MARLLQDTSKTFTPPLNDNDRRKIQLQSPSPPFSPLGEATIALFLFASSCMSASPSARIPITHTHGDQRRCAGICNIRKQAMQANKAASLSLVLVPSPAPHLRRSRIPLSSPASSRPYPSPSCPVTQGPELGDDLQVLLLSRSLPFPSHLARLAYRDKFVCPSRFHSESTFCMSSPRQRPIPSRPCNSGQIKQRDASFSGPSSAHDTCLLLYAHAHTSLG